MLDKKIERLFPNKSKIQPKPSANIKFAMDQSTVAVISFTKNEYDLIIEKTKKDVVEQLAKKMGQNPYELFSSLDTELPKQTPKIRALKLSKSWPYGGICARRKPDMGLDLVTNPAVVSIRWSSINRPKDLDNLRIQVDMEKSTSTFWKLAIGSKAAYANECGLAKVIDYDEASEGWIAKYYEGSETLVQESDNISIGTINYISLPHQTQTNAQSTTEPNPFNLSQETTQPLAQPTAPPFGLPPTAQPTAQPSAQLFGLPPTAQPTNTFGFTQPTTQPNMFTAQSLAPANVGFAFNQPSSADPRTLTLPFGNTTLQRPNQGFVNQKHVVTPNPFGTTKNAWGKK